MLLVGLVLLLVGLGFKVAAAPFHMWTPDVYQGAPTPVTAFMAAATKAAAFAAMLRIFVGAFQLYRSTGGRRSSGSPCSRCSSASIAAVVQTDVKRMLAYQSIAHAGFILIGVQAATDKGTSAALFYALVVRGDGDGRVRDRDGGRAPRRRPPRARRLPRARPSARPVLAGLLTLFLLAQAGVPFTGGFVAKLAVFSAAVDAGQYWLALIGMLVAVIGAFVYLRIVLAMYAPPTTRPPARRVRASASTPAPASRSPIAAAAIVFLGIVPGVMLDFARDATQLLAPLTRRLRGGLPPRQTARVTRRGGARSVAAAWSSSASSSGPRPGVVFVERDASS